MIAGKPLVQWAIDSAIGCNKICKVYLSTDSKKIADICNLFGYGKLEVIGRNPKSSTDEASTELVINEFAEKYEFENLILIQPTSPLLMSQDIDNAIDIYEQKEADSLLSVVEQKRFVWQIKNDGFVQPVNYEPEYRPRRQDFEGFIVENGAIYITKKENFLRTGCRLSGNIAYYKMPERSYYEIDEPDDWEIVEHFLQCKVPSNPHPIKLFLTDVDGVLTDSGMYYSEKGDELKKFSTHDGKGIELLRKAGIKTGLITSEETNIVKNRADKLKVDYLYQGVNHKLLIAKQICLKEGIDLADVAYIGDDINDIELLNNVGLAACPSNATTDVKKIGGIINLNRSGGNGAVREFIEIILTSCIPNKNIHNRK